MNGHVMRFIPTGTNILGGVWVAFCPITGTEVPTYHPMNNSQRFCQGCDAELPSGT